MSCVNIDIFIDARVLSEPTFRWLTLGTVRGIVRGPIVIILLIAMQGAVGVFLVFSVIQYNL